MTSVSIEKLDGDRGEYWHDALWRTCPPITRTFDGLVNSCCIGDVRFATSELESTEVEWTDNLIRESTDRFLLVWLQAHGRSALDQRGNHASLHPGDFVVVDPGEPYRFIMSETCKMRIFRIPRSRFGYAQSSVAKLAGVPISGTCGPARLVSHFLGTLADEAAAASPGMANNIAMVTRGIDLVGTMAADLVANADLSAAAAAELRNRVLAYIDENLSDSRLGVAQVARAHGVSVRSLQKLFAITGRTVSETIPQGRLEAIRRELELPRSKDRTIFSVARDHGYVDGPHFSRSFRAAYGMSPHAWQTYTRGLSGI